MTPRLEAARKAMLFAIERYARPHRSQLVNAANELEAAARECGEPLSEPPMTASPTVHNTDAPAVMGDKPHEPPYRDALAEAVAREGVEVVSPQSLPPAPQLPTAQEAVREALAPHDSTPEPTAASGRRTRSK